MLLKHIQRSGTSSSKNIDFRNYARKLLRNNSFSSNFLTASDVRQNIDVELFVHFLKSTSSCWRETLLNKNNAHLGPTQLPTNNSAAIV
jgi:hypothetical protein